MTNYQTQTLRATTGALGYGSRSLNDFKNEWNHITADYFTNPGDRFPSADYSKVVLKIRIVPRIETPLHAMLWDDFMPSRHPFLI